LPLRVKRVAGRTLQQEAAANGPFSFGLYRLLPVGRRPDTGYGLTLAPGGDPHAWGRGR